MTPLLSPGLLLLLVFLGGCTGSRDSTTPGDIPDSGGGADVFVLDSAGDTGDSTEMLTDTRTTEDGVVTGDEWTGELGDVLDGDSSPGVADVVESDAPVDDIIIDAADVIDPAGDASGCSSDLGPLPDYVFDFPPQDPKDCSPMVNTQCNDASQCRVLNDNYISPSTTITSPHL